MSQLGAVKIVEAFWSDVWVARNPEAVDRYVVPQRLSHLAAKIRLRFRGHCQNTIG